MKGGVEARHGGQLRPKSMQGTNGPQSGCVVERGQVLKALQSGHGLAVEAGRLGELHSSMDDAVPCQVHWSRVSEEVVDPLLPVVIDTEVPCG
jgi:hypothetical protein